MKPEAGAKTSGPRAIPRSILQQTLVLAAMGISLGLYPPQNSPRNKQRVVWQQYVAAGWCTSFWGTLREALAPGGRVLFVDTGLEEARFERFVPEAGIPLVERALRDGSRRRVVKVLHEPTDLAARLAAIGWRANTDRGRAEPSLAGTAVPS